MLPIDGRRLYHVMAQSTTDPNLFTWTEVYVDEAAMFAHVENTGSAGLSHLLSAYTHVGEDALFSEPMAMEAFGPLTKKATDALGSFGGKISLNTSVGFGGTGWAPRVKGEVGSGQTIVLQAICKVKPEKMEQFMALSEEIDRLVEEEEPGMYVTHVPLQMCALS